MTSINLNWLKRCWSWTELNCCVWVSRTSCCFFFFFFLQNTYLPSHLPASCQKHPLPSFFLCRKLWEQISFWLSIFRDNPSGVTALTHSHQLTFLSVVLWFYLREIKTGWVIRFYFLTLAYDKTRNTSLKNMLNLSVSAKQTDFFFLISWNYSVSAKKILFTLILFLFFCDKYVLQEVCFYHSILFVTYTWFWFKTPKMSKTI